MRVEHVLGRVKTAFSDGDCSRRKKLSGKWVRTGGMRVAVGEKIYNEVLGRKGWLRPGSAEMEFRRFGGELRKEGARGPPGGRV